MKKHFMPVFYEHSYGSAYAYEEEGKYYLALDADMVVERKEISKEFYFAIEKEFGERYKDII